MSQQTSLMHHVSVSVPDGVNVVNYGGGVNSVAVLVMLARVGVVPRAIVMCNPGSEWRATMSYVSDVMTPWLSASGFPPITVVSRAEEAEYRERAKLRETLRENCLRMKMLPSVAYGFKKCSFKYKAETANWWFERQPWAQDEWAAGRRLVKVIGYDGGEPERVRPDFGKEWENQRFVPWYPLFAQDYDRDDCEWLIEQAGLPLPKKSACTFCPNNTLAEWERLRTEEPDSFADAVAMSRLAAETITDPDVVGLMRCNPHGKRQLHVWADGGYQLDGAEVENPQPCECAA